MSGSGTGETSCQKLKSPELRDFGLGNPNYKADKVKFTIRNAYPTNIYRLLAALDEKDKEGNEQLCQYFPGVGTIKVPDAEDLGVLLRLMHLTVVQTKIVFVGWSHDAFTARAVAGMVSRYGKYRTDEFTGLVNKLRATYFKQNIDKARIASKIQWSLEDTRLAVANHETLGNFLPADVEAYACWETVGSFGVPLSTWHKAVINNEKLAGIMEPFKKTLKGWGVDVDKPMTFEHFYDQILPEKAKFAFHALALNEYMEPFRPTLWEKPNGNQKLVQCWFPGDHIDCGSGGRDRQIPDITLAWTMTQLDNNGVLKFKPGYIKDASKESKDIATKEKYRIPKWGHGETTSMYNLVDGAVGCLAVGSVMGSNPRDPGNYHRLNADGSRSNDLLEKTGEYIHKSVRVPLEAKTGLGANGKGDYAPKALGNWKAPYEGKYYWNSSISSHTPPYLEEPALEGYENEMYTVYEDEAKKPATNSTAPKNSAT